LSRKSSENIKTFARLLLQSSAGQVCFCKTNIITHKNCTKL